MKKHRQYQDYIAHLYGGETDLLEHEFLTRNITFQVTDDCTACCTYCYQGHKGHRMMTKDVAKRGVDLIFDMYDRNEGTFINHKTKAIILDFIGGEPLMNIDIIDYVCTYFMEQCIKRNHPWIYTWRASMISNGSLYFDPKVQAFLKKFRGFVCFGITLDGPKEIHNSCRVYHDGRGNFDDAYAAMKHFNSHYYEESSTKVTIAPENLHNLNKIVQFFVDEGMEDINANTVFEAEWTEDQAKEFYVELKKMADYLIELNNEDIDVSLFREDVFRPISEEDNQNFCGGTGAMLAFDPEGIAYPCLRYMKSSLGDAVPPITVGTVDGIFETEKDKETKRCLDCITRRSQSTDECWNCPIGAGCAWCFPAGTKIKTNFGLKNIEELINGDIVIDKDGNEQKVIRATSHVADDLIYVKAAGLKDLLTTEEHPFWCKPIEKKHHGYPIYGEPQWVKAKDLKTGYKIGLYTPSFENGKDVDKEIAYLLGRYIGDGWKTSSNRNKTPYEYGICCSFDEQEELEKHFNDGNIKATKSINRTVAQYNVLTTGEKNSELVKLLDQCGRYAKDKNVPEEVWGWNRESVISVLNGYFDADGSLDKDTQRYSSVSYELFLNIAELVRGVYHKNVSISVRYPNPIGTIEGRTVNQSVSYEGRFHINDESKHFYEYDEDNNIMWVNVRPSKKEVPSNIEVYNIEVENNPTYIADGAMVHNCSAWNYQLHGTPDKRCTRICPMHKARSLANVYYWNTYYRKHNIDKRFEMHLPKEEALKFITEDEYNMLLELSTK